MADSGSQLARAANVEPGKLVYLWGDAIANEIYEHRLDLERLEKPGLIPNRQEDE